MRTQTAAAAAPSAAVVRAARLSARSMRCSSPRRRVSARAAARCRMLVRHAATPEYHRRARVVQRGERALLLLQALGVFPAQRLRLHLAPRHPEPLRLLLPRCARRRLFRLRRVALVRMPGALRGSQTGSRGEKTPQGGVGHWARVHQLALLLGLLPLTLLGGHPLLVRRPPLPPLRLPRLHRRHPRRRATLHRSSDTRSTVLAGRPGGRAARGAPVGALLARDRRRATALGRRGASVADAPGLAGRRRGRWRRRGR